MTFQSNKIIKSNLWVLLFSIFTSSTRHWSGFAVSWRLSVLVSSILGLPWGRSCRRHPAQKGIHFAPRPQSPPDCLWRWFKVNWAQKMISHRSYAPILNDVPARCSVHRFCNNLYSGNIRLFLVLQSAGLISLFLSLQRPDNKCDNIYLYYSQLLKI